MWKTYDFSLPAPPPAPQGYRYLLYLVHDRYFPASTDGERILAAIRDVFASDIGRAAAVIESFPEQVEHNRDLLLQKNWPQSHRDILESGHNAYLVLLGTDFVTFDPQQHRYSLIRLPPDELDCLDSLRVLAANIRAGEDLFRYIEMRSSLATRLRKRFVDAVELKPQLFGIAIDLKTLVKPLT
jgi:hypothetical protein